MLMPETLPMPYFQLDCSPARNYKPAKGMSMFPYCRKNNVVILKSLNPCIQAMSMFPFYRKENVVNENTKILISKV